eukprot:gene3069-3533_t
MVSNRDQMKESNRDQMKFFQREFVQATCLPCPFVTQSHTSTRSTTTQPQKATFVETSSKDITTTLSNSYRNSGFIRSKMSNIDGALQNGFFSQICEDPRYMDRITIVKTRASDYLLTKLRNKDTTAKDFMIYGDRLMRILAEEALASLPNIDYGEVDTPCGKAVGLVKKGKEKVCVVSIPRSGDILQEAVRQIKPGVRIGKILIQRDESTKDKRPILYYKKLPKDISECFVILVDPMLATAGSAKRAISVLIEAGVQEDRIMFLNLVCCPEGIKNLVNEFPKISIITGAIDKCLNEERFIVPGLGDYGDRYYGTETVALSYKLCSVCEQLFVYFGFSLFSIGK